jgi:DNA-binding Lrp family transcriptional regulator
MVQQAVLDRIDMIVIKQLLDDGRASFSSIAKETGLTDVAIKKRVESLKRRGIISNISAELNHKVLGFENPIYVQMRSEVSKNKDLIKKLNAFDFMVELYQVLGEYNLIGKILVPNIDSAEKVINQLGVLDGIIDLKTLVVLSELKKSKSLPAQALQKTL